MPKKLQVVNHTILPSQELLFDNATPYIAFIGGAGSGKTTGGGLKALKFCLEYPGIKGAVTAPSYKMLEGATVPVYEQLFTNGFIQSFNKTEMVLETKNGSKLFFRTTKDPYLLRGGTYGFFHMDEAAESPALAFKILQARLRQEKTPQQGWITTTPRGFNWVYAEFMAQERENYVVCRAKTADNFMLPPDYVQKLKESYTDDQFRLQELEGEFIEVGGQCPFNMKILNEMYHEAKIRECGREQTFIYNYISSQLGKRYIIAADAATGQGEDESAFVVALATPAGTEIVSCGKQKISEYEFAEILYKKAQEYNNAFIIVEAAGVGKATLNKLDELHANIYRSKTNPQYKLGFPVAGPTIKPMMVAELAEVIASRSITIPHLEIIEQLMSYCRKKNGQYGAASGAKDDYVSALMLLIQGIKDVPAPMKIRVVYT